MAAAASEAEQPAAAAPSPVMPAAPERQATVISGGALPFFLAAIAGWQDVINQQQYKCYCNMNTGNTLNLAMAFGSGDWYPNVPFLAANIVHFCESGERERGERARAIERALHAHSLPCTYRATRSLAFAEQCLTAGTGYAIFKAVDNKLEQRGSTTAIAPVILGLFVVTDLLRPRFPDVRWHMWYSSMACGMVNAVSAEKGNAVTCMVTGHSKRAAAANSVAAAMFASRSLKLCGVALAVMTLAGSVSDFLQCGSSPKLRKAVTQSAGVLTCFAGGCAAGMQLWTRGMPSAMPFGRLLTRWRYLFFGLLYAIVLVLHERPRKRVK